MDDELKLLSRIIYYDKYLQSFGYNVKLKFWKIGLIDVNGIDDPIVLKKDVDYKFLALFETLLSGKTVCFDSSELMALSNLFNVSINQMVIFFDCFIGISQDILSKDERSEEEKDIVNSFLDTLKAFKMSMLNYWVNALEDMTVGLQIERDLMLEKYDNNFLIETLLLGDR